MSKKSCQLIKNHPRFLLLTFENMYFSELLKHWITQPLHLFPTLFSLRRKKQPKYDDGDSASLGRIWTIDGHEKESCNFKTKTLNFALKKQNESKKSQKYWLEPAPVLICSFITMSLSMIKVSKKRFPKISRILV